MREIAIVGGGPAGATCGERLARAGFRVTIFDEHLAWEKPCGGGLTYKAIQTYPFLLDSSHPKKLIRLAELIAGNGERVRLELNRPVVVYSRRVLNGLLLERAAAAGCTIERNRVTRVDTSGEQARLRLNGHECAADFVVLAAGARNSLLPETTPLAPQDLDLTVGYFVPTHHEPGNDGAHLHGAEARSANNASGTNPNTNVLKIKFVHGFKGYLWSFPRADHLSVGICGAMERTTSRELKQHVFEFMRVEDIPLPCSGNSGAAPRFFSHVLPSPRLTTLRRRRVLGRNWALVGDAAAWVDPLTGEGLYYAMRSGELLADALAKGTPEDYPRYARRGFCAELEIASRAARRFFRGTFLGSAITTRMVQFVKRSPALQRVMADLFSGEQDYRSLKQRLRSRIGSVLGELLWGALTR